MELVEVKAKTVELAKQAALQELGVENSDRVEWEVLQEPARGFLGVGRQDAIVSGKLKPARRRRSRGGRGGRGAKGGGRKPSGRSGQKKPAGPARGKGSGGRAAKSSGRGRSPKKNVDSPIDKQAAAAEDFLTGLLKAVDMPGKVETRHEENLIVAEVVGDDVEILVGQHGGGIEALHTIAKSVIKRKTSGGARLRLDVAGYTRRRREALAIYATGLVEQVQAEGGELMLEPMNAADRKVIHDTVAGYPDVRSFSEGDAPHRYVVLAHVE